MGMLVVLIQPYLHSYRVHSIVNSDMGGSLLHGMPALAMTTSRGPNLASACAIACCT